MMKHCVRLLSLLLLLFSVGVAPASADLLAQKVLYVGHRAGEFEPTLKKHFARVESTSRDAFTPAQAAEFVVLLDWPQGGSATREARSSGVTPLGKREEWSKPTVLLGSAGLNLAVAWELKGGSG